MNIKSSVQNIQPGYYAIAVSNFTAYSKSNLDEYKVCIMTVKTGDMFFVIEKDNEKYSKWPVKIITERYGSLHINNIDSHHFIYAKCGQNLTNKTFCITGELTHPRTVYQKIIEMNGGEFKSTVSKNINYLISNKSRASTKMIKAREMGVEIINESEFLIMVG